MSEYRSALHAAELRIEQLEADVAGLGPRPREPRVVPRRLVGLFAGVLLPTLVFGLAGAAKRSSRPPTFTTLVEPPPRTEVERPRGGLRWFDQHHWAEGGGPTFADLDANTRDIVGLAWDRSLAADGLYAVALERETLGPRWKAGPFPGVWPLGSVEIHHVVVFGARVIVTDARGGVHVLSARTGEVLLERKLGRAIESACVSEDGARRLFFANAPYWRPSYPGDTGSGYFPWEINSAARMSFDPMTGRTGSAPSGLGCPMQPTYCSKNANALPTLVDCCRDLDETKETPWSSPGFVPNEVWRSGDDRVTVGAIAEHHLVVGWSRKTKSLRWQASLDASESQPRRQASLSGIGDGSFARVSTTPEHRLAIVVFDLQTGARRFSQELPGTGIGSELVSVSVDRGDVFVGVDDELFVIDARTGRLRKRIDSL